MDMLKRWITPFVFALCMIGLAACGSSSTMPIETASAPTATAVAIRLTETLRPTETPIPTLTSTMTPVPTSTRLPTIVKTPNVLTVTNPTNEQISAFLAQAHPQAGRFDLVISRQDVDVNGDGNKEILVIVESDPWFLYYAILGQGKAGWSEWFYKEFAGHYCAKIRSTVKSNYVVTDNLICGGGTGVLNVKWTQEWVLCQDARCDAVWNAPIWNTFRLAMPLPPPYDQRSYTIAQVESPDSNTIRVTTHQFGSTIPILSRMQQTVSATTNLPNMARRFIGPETVDIYRWNGNRFERESHEQVSAGQSIANEFDERTLETIRQVNDTLAVPFRKEDGTFDASGFDAVAKEFWGPAAIITWDNWYRDSSANVASHNGDPGQLGDRIAAVVQISNERPLCGLTVQKYISSTFQLIGRIELPCTISFTRLMWEDVNADGQKDLLLITMPPDEDLQETGAGLQRLYVFDVTDGVKQITMLDGAINGADGAGIRWRKTNEGTSEILAGLPFMPLTLAVTSWPNLDRRFQIYHWDAKTQSLVPQEIEIEP